MSEYLAPLETLKNCYKGLQPITDTQEDHTISTEHRPIVVIKEVRAQRASGISCNLVGWYFLSPKCTVHTLFLYLLVQKCLWYPAVRDQILSRFVVKWWKSRQRTSFELYFAHCLVTSPWPWFIIVTHWARPALNQNVLPFDVPSYLLVEPLQIAIIISMRF